MENNMIICRLELKVIVRCVLEYLLNVIRNLLIKKWK